MNKAHTSNARILVINCGSSSLKFALLEADVFLAEGVFERLGTPSASGRWKIGGEATTEKMSGADHAKSLARAVEILEAHFDKPLRVDAVGHRVVHGGESFRDATLVDDEVLAKIESCNPLAPLHNPANVLGIRVARELFPHVPHIVVFDTAFHQTMPQRAWLYAVPFELYEEHAVRRYGFHGTSHGYVAEKAAEALGRPLETLHLITAHLGNGCSACAIRESRSVDTTMGLTPLEGLVMGTRSGDVDPDLPQYLRRVAGMSSDAVSEMLNRKSGLLGVSGVSNDMRTVIKAASEGNRRAELAIELFCYRLAKAVLGLAAALNRIDALIFTGGIGENSALIREGTLEFLSLLRPQLDATLNTAHGVGANGRITREASALTCLVIPTSEERAIAKSAAAFVTSPHPL